MSESKVIDIAERLDTETTEDKLQVVVHTQRYDFALERLNSNDVVLEVGTGLGSCSVRLADRCRQFTGLEFDAEACEATRRRLNGRGTVVQADAQAMPFADGSFSAIVCLETLEHLPNYRKAVEEIHRCLKPGGRALISVPYCKHSVQRPINPFHTYEPGESEMVGVFQHYFRQVEVWYQYFEETPLMAFARSLRIRRFLGLAQIYRDLTAGMPHATAMLKVARSSHGANMSLLLNAYERK